MLWIHSFERNMLKDFICYAGECRTSGRCHPSYKYLDFAILVKMKVNTNIIEQACFVLFLEPVGK